MTRAGLLRIKRRNVDGHAGRFEQLGNGPLKPFQFNALGFDRSVGNDFGVPICHWPAAHGRSPTGGVNLTPS